MNHRSDYTTDDTRASEIGVLSHNGHEYAAGGFSIDLEAGRMIAYVSEAPHSASRVDRYLLTTREGVVVARMARTDSHTREFCRYGQCCRGKSPRGFGGVALQCFRTLEPIAGYYWYGKGLGAGMMLRLKRGRKA